MPKSKTLAKAAVVTVASAAILISSVSVFADQTNAISGKIFGKPIAKGFMDADPLERLQKEKEAIQQKVKDGKLTQEQADKRIAEIDQRIKEIQDFNNLTLDQKKEKLLSSFTTSINEKVKNGKLAQDKADQEIANFKTKLDAWDGTGNPPFIGRGLMEKADGFRDKEGFKGNVDPAKMLEEQKKAIQQKVTDGKLTQEEADKKIAALEQRVKEIQEFNSLTLDQKKEKLLSKYTSSINERVKDGKLTQEQADKNIADFKAKLEQWDGSGRIPFMGSEHKDGKGFGGRSHKEKSADASQQSNVQ